MLEKHRRNRLKLVSPGLCGDLLQRLKQSHDAANTYERSIKASDPLKYRAGREKVTSALPVPLGFWSPLPLPTLYGQTPDQPPRAAAMLFI